MQRPNVPGLDDRGRFSLRRDRSRFGSQCQAKALNRWDCEHVEVDDVINNLRLRTPDNRCDGSARSHCFVNTMLSIVAFT
jgi:hypothetical protein